MNCDNMLVVLIQHQGVMDGQRDRRTKGLNIARYIHEWIRTCDKNATSRLHSYTQCLLINPLTLAVVYLPVPDPVKPSFVIFDIRALWRSGLDVKNYKWRLNPVWHRMLYSCMAASIMATAGVKGLIKGLVCFYTTQNKGCVTWVFIASCSAPFSTRSSQLVSSRMTSDAIDITEIWSEFRNPRRLFVISPTAATLWQWR